MLIDRCYCYQKTFKALKGIAVDTDSTTIEELQKHVEFGSNCGLCHVYVREMLRTGRVEFDQIIEPNPLHRDR